MEVNKEEAIRCHEIALTKESRGEIAAALKFIRKSIALFPTPEAKASLDRVSKLNTAGTATPNFTPGDTPKRATFNSTPSSRAESNSSQTNNQRGYTPAQTEAVKKIKANAQDFYLVLGLSKTATDSEIKKSYRKLALQFHPDKNSAPGADEAFKLVSKAFAILSDADKRAQYDRFGGDPEQRGGGGGGRGSAASYSSYHEEVSPEDLFNMFFGGGLGGGGGGFQSATFVGPDGRRYVRQFGGGAQQRRYTNANQGNEGFTFNFLQLLPVLLLLGFSFLSSLFQDSGPSVPQYAFPKVNEVNPNVLKTRKRGVPYIASPIDIRNFRKKAGERRFDRFESDVENFYIQWLSANCREERDGLERDRITAGGIFGWGRDEDKLRETKNQYGQKR